MPLEIRPYQPSDGAPLRARFNGDTRPPWMRLPHPYTLEQLLASEGDTEVLVLESSHQQALGLVALDPSGQRPLLVGPLLPDDQLADLYGRALLDDALERAVARGATQVRVMIDVEEQRGIGFYLNQGFVSLDMRQHVLVAHPSKHEPLPVPEGFSFGPCPEMLSSDYIRLYQNIGGPLGWPDRSQWSRPRIFEHLQRPGLHLLAAREGDAFIGFAELEERRPGEAELVYFGLLEAYRGRGLGGCFVSHMLQYAWETLRLQQIRVMVRSCEAPQAMPNFLKHGFDQERDMVILEKTLLPVEPRRDEKVAP